MSQRLSWVRCSMEIELEYKLEHEAELNFCTIKFHAFQWSVSPMSNSFLMHVMKVNHSNRHDVPQAARRTKFNLNTLCIITFIC